MDGSAEDYIRDLSHADPRLIDRIMHRVEQEGDIGESEYNELCEVCTAE